MTLYVRGAGMSLARIEVDTVALTYTRTYLHPDQLGSATAGTSQSGAVLWREQYAPYGDKLTAPTANDDLGSFTGHIDDDATTDMNLTYMQARYYDPGAGRFTSIDPVTFLADGRPGMVNRYAYALGDPVNMVDPDGNRAQPPEVKTPVSHKVRLAAQGAKDAIGHSLAGLSPQASYNQADRAIMNMGDAQAYAAGATLALAATLAGPGDEVAVGDSVGKGIAKVSDDAKSALSSLNLQKQLASEAQMADLAAGGGTIISQPAKQAKRVASQTGRDPANIQKVSSDSFVAKDGQAIQTHAFRDASDNTIIAPKTVIREEN